MTRSSPNITTEKPLRGRHRILLAFTVGAVVAGVVLSHYVCRTSRDGSFHAAGKLAEVFWVEEGAPMQICCTIVDLQGRGIPFVQIDFRSASGGTLAKTDGAGNVKISLAEREVEQIVLAGEVVLNRPRAYWKGHPTVRNGLLVLIVVKDRAFLNERERTPGTGP